jgi:hypothetical protein
VYDINNAGEIVGYGTHNGAYQRAFLLKIDDESDGDGDGILDNEDNCPNTANPDQADFDDDGLGDICDDDDDNDGILDDDDAFPMSDTGPTVSIDGCESGIPNMILSNGASFNDLIAECAVNARNHGQFVNCVSTLTNEWRKDGLITGQQESQIINAVNGNCQ